MSPCFVYLTNNFNNKTNKKEIDMDKTFWGETIVSYTTDQAVKDGILTEFKNSPNFLFAPYAMIEINKLMEKRGCTLEQIMAPIIIDAQNSMIPYMEITGETLMTDTPFCEESGFWVALNDRKGLTIMKSEDY
jgi:hypothetical protein